MLEEVKKNHKKAILLDILLIIKKQNGRIAKASASPIDTR